MGRLKKTYTPKVDRKIWNAYTRLIERNHYYDIDIGCFLKYKKQTKGDFIADALNTWLEIHFRHRTDFTFPDFPLGLADELDYAAILDRKKVIDILEDAITDKLATLYSSNLIKTDNP